MECKITQAAMRKALEDQTRANATVDGLLRMLANKKAIQIERFIESKSELKVKGFTMTLVNVSYNIYPWSDEPLELYAQFMVKDTEWTTPLTKKEASAVKKYKELIGDIKWNWKNELKKRYSQAQSLSAEVSSLKNSIFFTKKYLWRYSYNDILKDTFLLQVVGLEVQ